VSAALARRQIEALPGAASANVASAGRIAASGASSAPTSVGAPVSKNDLGGFGIVEIGEAAVAPRRR
jgi:hypothetical protein